MKRYLSSVVCVVFFFIMVSPVPARQQRDPDRQKRVQRWNETLDKMDANKDKEITREECTAYFEEKAKRRAEKVFGRMDLNSDGVVSADEVEKARKRGAAKEKE